MSKYNIDNSLQTMDQASLIWKTNETIMKAIDDGNLQVIPNLVEFLETSLWPYRDQKYVDEIEKIDNLKSKQGNTINQIKYNAKALEDTKVTLKHRALQGLAFRKRFLPATGSHQSDNYVMGDGSHESQ